MEKRKKKRPQHGHFLLAEGVSLGFLASLRCRQSSSAAAPPSPSPAITTRFGRPHCYYFFLFASNFGINFSFFIRRLGHALAAVAASATEAAPRLLRSSILRAVDRQFDTPRHMPTSTTMSTCSPVVEQGKHLFKIVGYSKAQGDGP